MKKILTFCFILAGFCLLSSETNAQIHGFVGLKMGGNISTFNGDTDGLDVNPKTAFAGGLLGDFTYKKSDSTYSRFSLLAELNYMPFGYKNDAYKEKLHYLQIPLLLKFHFGVLGGMRSGFYINGGGYGSYLIGAKVKGDDGDMDIKSNYETIDYGVAFGGGISLVSIISIDFRYNLGLVDISKDDAREIFNRSWGIYLHLAVPLDFRN